jgi:ADP-ribose pyrophosphatase YjhB (NUDIX family)
MSRTLPRLVVAAVIERDDEFLLVDEMDLDRRVYNQPAGHVEHGESIIDAVRREVLEETAWRFEPEAVTGIYRIAVPERDTTFVRVCFRGRLLSHHPERPLDDGILEAVWLSRATLAADPARLRSRLVLASIDDYLAGSSYPLELLKDYG